MSRASTYIGAKRPRTWQYLLAAMRDDALPPPSSDRALEALLADAQRNELTPNVAHALLRGGDTRQQVQATHEAAERRIETMLAAADDVAAVLAEAGIPTLALKNVGIARGIYPCAACTPMGDVDLVVQRPDFRKAHRLLIDHGLAHDTRAPQIEPADIDHGYESGGCEYRYGAGADEVWVELQWRPVAGRWIQPHQEPDAGELIDRSRPIEGTALRLLDPTDNMLQVCLHTAKHSYCRAPGLRLHTDVHRLATYDPPDWDSLIDAVGDAEVATAVYFSLDIARSLLGSPVPDEVLDRLAPDPVRQRLVGGMLRRASIFDPHEHKFNRVEMIAFHGVLYDSLMLLLSSATETPHDEIRIRNLGLISDRAGRRIRDLVSNYQR